MTQIDAGSPLDTESFVSWREFLGSPHVASLALVCLAVWLHAADSLLVATMLPAIVADLGHAALVSWTISLYQIGSIVAGAASALLVMRFGLGRPMGLAAGLFCIGCTLSAISPTMPLLLVGRALQGLGAGGLVSMSFVAVNLLFPRRYTARALASISTLWGVSAFLGPLVGGVFVQYATWRWGFAFFAAQALGLALWILLRGEPAAARAAAVPETGRFPLGRLSVLTLTVLIFSYGGVDVSPLRTGALVVAGVLSLAAFLWLDGRATGNRLLPRAPLDIRKPTGAALVMILSLSMASIAITAFGPILVTAIYHQSALVAGYVIACSSIGWTCMAVLVSGLPERHDRRMIALGMGTVALSILGFVYTVPHGPVWLIALVAAIEGGGFGMCWTFILRRTTALAPPSEIQRTAGAIPTMQRLGYALGAACIGIVANASGFLDMQTPTQASAVASRIFIASLPFAVLGLVAMTALVRSPKNRMRSAKNRMRSAKKLPPPA